MDIKTFISFLVPPSKPTRNDESKFGKFQRSKQWQSSDDALTRMNILCTVFKLSKFSTIQPIPTVKTFLNAEGNFDDQILLDAANGGASAINTVCKNLKALIYCIVGPEEKYKTESEILKTLVTGDNLFHFIENCRKKNEEARNQRLHRPVPGSQVFTASITPKKVIGMGPKATAFLANLDPGYGGSGTLLPEDRLKKLIRLGLKAMQNRTKEFSKAQYKEELLQVVAQYKRFPELLDYLCDLFDLGKKKLLQVPQLYASMIDELIDENFNLDQFIKKNKIDEITEPGAKKAFLKTVLFCALTHDFNIDNFSSNFVELYFYCKEDRRISET